MSSPSPRGTERFITGRGLTLSAVLQRARNGSNDRVLGLLARHRLDAPPVPPKLGVAWLARTMVELTRDEYDAVLAVTGKEGVSKSMLSLEVSLEVARLTGRPWSFDRLCYTAREVLTCYETVEQGDVIWVDEGARSLWAGETMDPEQQALTKALTIVRAKGAILIICVPDIFLLAKKVRGRRASFWAHVESRGTRRRPAPSEARLFERDDRLRFVPTAALGLSESLRCPHLTYEPLPEGDPWLAAYRRSKADKTQQFLAETIRDLDAADERAARRALRRAPVEVSDEA